MKPFRLQALLSRSKRTPLPPSGLFALLSLGVIDSLAHGSLSAVEAVQLFFHADNCLYVRRNLRKKAADQIMSHGVQLLDLFAALPPEESHREFQHELAAMRALCLKLLDENRSVA